MSYLNQWASSTSATFCEVIHVKNQKQNYAIFMGSDPSLITCEKTSSQVGVYNTDNLDTPISDENIIGIINSWYDKVTLFGGMTVRELAAYLIDEAISGQKLPLFGLPKMTKVLASALSSIKELMVIYLDDNQYKYLCFGYRGPVAEFIEANQLQAFYFFPERFYIAAQFDTRFKNDFNLVHLNKLCDAVGIINKSEDKIGLLMPVEWKTHTEFLLRGFTE